MKNKKIKCLILIVALFIARSQLYVFSETNSGESSNNGNVTGNSPQNSTTILDGQIGEWDPDDSDRPNFDNLGDEDIEGRKPRQGEYYTISVTVPISMEFYVLPNSQLAFGSFYSPEYSITNNGSKTLDIKLNTFTRENTTSRTASDETELYIEPIVHGDGKTQMELRLSAIDDSNPSSNKDIDLTKIGSLQSEEKTLYELQKNETKKVKFSADRWELPQYESGKDKAISNFTAGFEFSIKNNRN